MGHLSMYCFSVTNSPFSTWFVIMHWTLRHFSFTVSVIQCLVSRGRRRDTALGRGSPGSSVLGFAFSCCSMSGQQCGCIGTSSSSLSLRDLKSPAPAQACNHLSMALLTQIPYDPDSMPTMVSQVPVCAHMTALA